MTRRFNRIFEPIAIGNVEIKNRLAMAPMGIVGLINPDGSLGPRALDYYIERARGDVGLIISSVHKVENEIEAMAGAMALVSRAGLGAFTELAEALHALGARIFVQLTAGFGRVGSPRRLKGQPVSASAIPAFWNPSQTCRALTTDEVERLVKCFGDAALILAEAGIDGVELHGHEGYLFDQFTTSFWNHRTDKYGGVLANRLRLPMEVLREIKTRVGQEFVVQYRFGLKHYMKDFNSGALPGEKFVEAGRDIAEGLEMARLLEKAGFDALHVDAGCYDSWYWPHPPTYQEPGCMVEMPAQAKKVVKIPVIGVGKLSVPELAEQVLAEGKVDMVALGKGLLADPQWLKKVAAGRPEQIRPCIGCHDACMGRITRGKPLSCAVNPATGRERSYRLEHTDQPKRVLIAGGGAAGMEAARVAALRGHQVILYEKENGLGGHLLEASVPAFKKDLGRLLDWYREELENLKLETRLGTEVTVDLVAREKPEVVILATGSHPVIPDVPGIGGDKIASAVDLLRGRKKAGDKVLVLGGGLIGCELAIWLAQQGKKVTTVEITGELLTSGMPVQPMNRLMLLNLLRFHQVDSILHSTLLEVTPEGAILMDRCFARRNFLADTIALAVGLYPEQQLYRALRGRTPNLYLIGDSRKAQNVMHSIWEAYEVARWI